MNARARDRYGHTHFIKTTLCSEDPKMEIFSETSNTIVVQSQYFLVNHDSSVLSRLFHQTRLSILESGQYSERFEKEKKNENRGGSGGRYLGAPLRTYSVVRDCNLALNGFPFVCLFVCLALFAPLSAKTHLPLLSLTLEQTCSLLRSKERAFYRVSEVSRSPSR